MAKQAVGSEMNYESREEDDAALAALREVADHNTVQSVKRTILACLLIRAVRRPTTRRRRAVLSVLVLPAGFVVVRYWHIWSVLIHLRHLPSSAPTVLFPAP